MDTTPANGPSCSLEDSKDVHIDVNEQGEDEKGYSPNDESRGAKGPGFPWEVGKRWSCEDPLRFPIVSEGQTLKECREIVEVLDNGKCEAWKDEIQNLLIFAGLFSAIVTSFSVEVAGSLEDSPEDVTIQLLTQLLAVQLNSTANPTGMTVPEVPSFAPPPNATRVNILWTVSLTLSLAVTTVAILCLQWIREYQRQDPGRSHKDTLASRHVRDRSFAAWKVPFIISILPIILLVSLALFLVGLVDYFHAMSPLTAWILVSVVGPTLLVVVATTVLPGLYDFWVINGWQNRWRTPSDLFPSYCAYKSPQAWAFTMSCSTLVIAWSNFKDLLRPAWKRRPPPNSLTKVLNLPNWIAYDGWWRGHSKDDYVSSIFSLAQELKGTESSIPHGVYDCLRDMQTADELRKASKAILGPENVPSPKFFDENRVPVLKDLVMFNVGQELFVSQGLKHDLQDWQHLHRLELFTRLSQSLGSIREGSYTYGNLEPILTIECPPLFNDVDISKEKLPSLPSGLRIELFKCFQDRLNETQSTHPQGWAWPVVTPNVFNSMLALLSTFVLDPVEDVDASDEEGKAALVQSTAATRWPQTFSMVDAGFRSLANHPQSCDLFINCLAPWMNKYHKDAFRHNKTLLVESNGVWEFLDAVYSVGIEDRTWEQARLWENFELEIGFKVMSPSLRIQLLDDYTSALATYPNPELGTGTLPNRILEIALTFILDEHSPSTDRILLRNKIDGAFHLLVSFQRYLDLQGLDWRFCRQGLLPWTDPANEEMFLANRDLLDGGDATGFLDFLEILPRKWDSEMYYNEQWKRLGGLLGESEDDRESLEISDHEGDM